MRRRNDGFFIIEVLLAMVILSMVFLTLFSMISFLTNRTDRSKYDTQAAGLLQEGMEVSRNAILANWTTYSAGSYYPVFNGNSLQWTLKSGTEGTLKGQFTRSITIENVCRDPNKEGIQTSCTTGTPDPKSKIITITVSWIEGSVTKEVDSKLLLYRINQS